MVSSMTAVLKKRRLDVPLGFFWMFLDSPVRLTLRHSYDGQSVQMMP